MIKEILINSSEFLETLLKVMFFIIISKITYKLINKPK